MFHQSERDFPNVSTTVMNKIVPYCIPFLRELSLPLSLRKRLLRPFHFSRSTSILNLFGALTSS